MSKTKKKKKKLISLIIYIIIFLIIFSLVIYITIDREARNKKKIEVNNDLVSLDIKNLESDGISFEEAKQILNTSSKLLSFLNNNLFIEKKLDNYISKTPEQTFNDKKGNTVDLAVFSSYILKENNIHGGVISYEYINKDGENERNFVTVFREGDTPYYIIFDDKVKILKHGWSFKDLIKKEEERSSISVDRFTYFPAGI